MKFFNRIINKFNGFSQLRKNILSGSLFSALNTVITLLAYPIYFRYLGAEMYGLWTAVAVIVTISQLGQVGTDTAIMKYVAVEYEKKNYSGITEYTSTAFYLLLVPSGVIMFVILIFRSNIVQFLEVDASLQETCESLIVWVGLLSITSFYVNTLRGVIAGIGRMDISNYVFFAGRVVNVLLSVILIVVGFGVWGLYFGFLFYYIFAALLWGVILKRKYNIVVFKFSAFDKQKCRVLIKLGGTLFGGSIAQMLFIPFNKIIIAKYIGLSEVAFYQVAVQVVMSIRNLFVKGLESILPKISAMKEDSNKKLRNILDIHAKSMKLVFFLGFPIFMFIFLLAHMLLEIWLGEGFNSQIPVVLRILLVGWFINILSVPDYYMFIGIGKAGYSVGATYTKSIVNVLLVFTIIGISDDVSLTNIAIVNAISHLISVLYLKCLYFRIERKVSLA